MHAEGAQMITGRFRSRVFAFLLTLSIPTLAFADSLRGRVIDPQQARVAHAEVVILRGVTVVTTVTTAADGTFGPIALAPGEYDVVVAAPGFRAKPTHLVITAGTRTIDVEIPLVVSALSESVVVSAAQADLPLSRVAGSVTVVSREDMQVRQIASVADAVRLAPGMAVVLSGSTGEVTSFFPRGGDSDYTLVLVDGIPQNSFGGGFDAAHLTTADVERVEIVRGPESALFGGGAIGAVVQVITRHGGPLTANASFEGGGYGSTRGAASASGSRGSWGWGTAFEQLNTNGDTRFVPALGTRVSNDDYARTNASGSLGWSNTTGGAFRVDLRGAATDAGNPGPYGSDPAGLYAGIDTVTRTQNRTAEIGLSGSFAGPAHTRHHLQFTDAQLKGHYLSPYGSSDDKTTRASGRYQMDASLTPATTLSAGAEVLHERDDNTYITGLTSQPVPITRLVAGFFAEARTSIHSRGFISLGTRLERIQRNALQGDAYGARPTFADDVVWSANPKAAAAWYLSAPDASGWVKIHGSAGTGIKPPTAFDLAFTNNPDLKPERNVSGDAGVELAAAKQHVVLDTTWFDNRYRDLIVTVGSSYSGASRYSTDNIANARARGLEVSATARGGHGVAVRMGYTLLDTAVLGITNAPLFAPAPYTVGQPLVRRPRNQAFGDVTWTGAHGSAFVSAGGRGKDLDLEPNYASTTYTNPGFVVVSAGASRALGHGTELFARVSNLFNKSYEEAFGFPALGRTAAIGIRVARGR
jgi:outer membrane cobalamin receptor